MRHPSYREIHGVDVLSLIATIQQVRRWWHVRKWRSHWGNDQYLRKIAEKRQWIEVLRVFHFERNYKFIKLMVKADQQRGIL